MKNFLQAFGLAIAVHFFCRFIPVAWVWLFIAIYSFFFPKSDWKAFGIGFFAVFLAWGAYALFFDIINDQILSTKMGALLNGLPAWSLVLITAIVGGIGGGLSSMIGSLIQKLIR